MFDPLAHYLPLLNATITHAMANTTFYAERFAKIDLPLRNLAQLQELPLLTRDAISASGTAMVSRERTPDLIRNTSGSTFGALARRPLATFHTREERDVWNEITRHELGRRQPTNPLVLRFLTIDHGAEITGALPGVLPVPLATPAHFAHVVDLLGRSFALTGCSERIHGIVGTLTRLKLLTSLCLKNDIPADRFQVRFISSHSQLLTRRWRDLLRSYWGVDATEVYGLSEIPGLVGAQCEHGDHYHLSPRAFVETLDPDSLRPVTSGLARLVATGLYPLVQAHPLIRYDTEDLVRVMPPCPGTYQPSLQYVGRASTVVRVGAQVLLSPMILHDLVDSECDVAIEPSPLALPFDVQDVGFPKYNVRVRRSDVRTAIALSLELRREPRLYAQHDEALVRRLRSGILGREPELANALNRGTALLDIHLHAPGALRELSEA